MQGGVTENHAEQATLEWLAALGWEVGHGPDVSPPDAKTPGTERDSYREAALKHRLRDAIRRLNPQIPAGAQDEACRMVLNPNIPGPVQANRQMHRWLVEGVPVEYQKDGDTRGDRVRLVDWSEAARNDWLGLNQFCIQGPKQTRRPDVVQTDGKQLEGESLVDRLEKDFDAFLEWRATLVVLAAQHLTDGRLLTLEQLMTAAEAAEPALAK